MGAMPRPAILLLLLFFWPSSLHADFPSCTAADLSDRNYLPEVLQRIKAADESIEVSMYSIAIGTAAGDPAWQLIEALKAAAQNGTRVRLWLNSRQASMGSTKTFLREDIQENLQKAGLQIFYVDSKHRLHDKLVIID